MRQELSIEMVIAPGDRLLTEVARTLGRMALPPESFVWSAIPDTGEARVWMIVSTGQTSLRELTTNLGLIPGVRRVALHGPGQSIREALYIPRATR